MCFGGDNTASDIAKQTRADEVARQTRIKTGMANINAVFDGPNGFNDAFYAKQGKAYSDYATPQVDHQYGLAKDQTVYALARSGLLDSLAGQNENAELSRTNDQSRIDIANQAQDEENTARSNVENTRGNIVSQLNATGDDAAASAAAVRGAQNLYQPTGYSPLADAFASFTNGLSRVGSNAGNNYSGLINNLPAIFASRGAGGSSTVVRSGG